MYYHNNRFKTPNAIRGQHSNNSNYFHDYTFPHSQPQHRPQDNNYYGQTSTSTHIYQSPPNYYAQPSGNPQRPQAQQPKRANPPKNQNPNQQVDQEKANPHQGDYKAYLCPGCSQHFDFLVRNHRYTGRVPLILNCHHTVCQDCIYKGAIANSLKCPTCKKPSAAPGRPLLTNLQEVFTPNFYLLGIIMWSKPQGNYVKQISLVPTQVTLNNRKLASGEQQIDAPEPEGEKCCFLSCHKNAVLRCQDCNDVYCVECCTVVHKSAKSLWSHVQVEITNGNFSAELEKCSEHGAMDIEFYCNSCDTAACCYCFLDKHEGHEKQYLSKLSSEEQNELHMYKEKAEQVLRQLLISQKKLKAMNTGGTSSIEKKISSYFANLHGQLHFVYKNLLNGLSNSQGTGPGESSLADVNLSLENSIKSWRNVLSAAENMNIKKINLRGILQKLREVELTPCYLLSETGVVSELTEFEPDPILENLDDLFQLKKSTTNSLRLVNENELPPDYVKDPYESDIETFITSYMHSSKKEESNQYNKRISTQSQSQSSHSKTSKSHGQKRRGKIDKKCITDIRNILQIPIDHEMIEVTHIESLECFYVQLKKNQSSFIQMNKDIENYVKIGNGKVSSPQINELYLAMYATKTEKMWCRGRVVEIRNQETRPLYEVYFLDYGNTQTLDINKLREITPQLAQRKPFAIQCELYNPADATWGKNAHVYMGKIINGKELYMIVKNINNGVYLVDLMVSSSDRGLTSIIDILIHTCSNALSSSSDSSLHSMKRKSSFIPELKIFSNSFKFQKHQTQSVTLANVIDPHHVFVHIANYIDLLESMASELKQYYKNKSSEGCIPVEGTYVVVEHRDLIRGNWHRALIKKVDMFQAKAHVLLVDWGINVVVPWSNIKVLTETFTKLESQAILVKLAHVEPYQSERGWSERATFFLQKNFRTQDPLKMIVHNVDPLEVALFETLGSVNYCINAQLVQEKLADSTGKISETVEWPEGDQEQLGFNEDEGFVATLLKKIDESPDEDSQEEQNEAEASVKQQIDVVKVDSPDLIYIKFQHLEQQEQSLHKELQIHYNTEKQMKETWNENEVCVAQLPDCYARGKIICQLEDKYKVNLYDKATEQILPKEKLFIFSDYFKKFPNIVYKCHLANIRPAGGDKWSLSSIEALQRAIDKYKDIYATKIPGDPKKKSIPMLMWYTQIKVGGALEPTVTKFISINKLLVKLGFAYKEPNKEFEIIKKIDAKFENPDSCKNGVTTSAIVHQDADKSDVSTESGTENEVVKEKPVINTTKGNSSNSSDWNDLIEEEEIASDSKQDSPYHTKEAEISDWKPAFPIKKHEFNAWVTCAESEGILYLRDEDLQPVYKDMEANLKQYFDSQPQSSTLLVNPDWQPGQICTICYKDYWYRGKILKIISPTEIVALMIDFGSDHTLSPKQLYREILYPEIPAFASKVKLDRVFSKSGDWISSDYDTLLDIVTEFAKVVIKGPLDAEIPLAEVYNDKGQSINELLVKLSPNLVRHLKPVLENSDEELALVEEEDTLVVAKDLENLIDTTSMEFKIEPLPDEAIEGKMSMHIVGVLAYNKVVLKLIAENYEDLISLNTDIQESCEKQPDLENVEVGMPCICPYAEDGLWYRALIHNVEGIDCGYVFVFFVDFGNVESVSIDNIKMMKQDWFNLHVSCYIADINIELKTDNHLEHVMQHMKKLFTKNKLVHIVTKNPLVVDLYEPNGELCYQSLINNGLLKVRN